MQVMTGVQEHGRCDRRINAIVNKYALFGECAAAYNSSLEWTAVAFPRIFDLFLARVADMYFNDLCRMTTRARCHAGSVRRQP